MSILVLKHDPSKSTLFKAKYRPSNQAAKNSSFWSQPVQFLVKCNYNQVAAVMTTNKFQTSSWKFITNSVKPPARWGHSSCIVKDTLYIFGGFANSIYMNDLWSYSATQKQWQQVTTFGDVPASRSNATLCYDDVNHQLLLFGGGGANKQRFNTVSTLDLNSLHWFEIPPYESEAAPWERTYHVAQFKFPYLIIFGGQGADDLEDLWTYNVTNLIWQQIKIYGQKPCARRFHSSCLIDNHLYVFGGCYGKYNCLKDMYSLDLSFLFQRGLMHSLQWKRVELLGEINERWGHTSSYYNGEIYIFGGRAADDMNDLVGVNLQTRVVRKVLASNQPAARRRHNGGIIGSSLVMFGGFDGAYYDDFFYINLIQPQPKTPIPQSTPHLLLKQPQQYLLDTNATPFYIHSALVAKYFHTERNMVAFLQALNCFYTKQTLQSVFTTLYAGEGNLALDQQHLKMMDWCPPQLSIPQRSIRAFLQGGSSPAMLNSLDSYCIQLQNSEFSSYLVKVESHWQMSDQIVLNNQYTFNCCYALMALHSHYFKYILSSKESRQKTLHFVLEIKPFIFQILLAYLHNNILVTCSQFSYNVYKELIELAEYFSIHRLVNICQEKLISLISSQNCTDLLAFSIQYKLQPLEQLCGLKYLLQLTQSRTKQPFALSQEEETKLDPKTKALYNQIKFDFVHICEQTQSLKNSKISAFSAEKQNEQITFLGRKISRYN